MQRIPQGADSSTFCGLFVHLLLNEGGKATLLLPSKVAYDVNGSGSIPGGEVILFDVELISINS